MSKCFDLRDIVWDEVCTIGAFLLLLLAVVATAALIGLFVVVVRLPINLYNSLFAVKKTAVSLQIFNFEKY